MTSNPGPFARRASDRLWPLSRGQSILLAGVVALCALFIFIPKRPIGLLVMALLLLVLMAGSPGKCGIDLATRWMRFATRVKWNHVQVTGRDGEVSIQARGRRTVCLYELDHRGRLDLTGMDLLIDDESAAMLESISLSPSAQFVSWHVRATKNSASIHLAVPDTVKPPARWRPVWPAGSFVAISQQTVVPAGWMYERWNYLRDSRGVSAVFVLLGSPTPLGIPVLNGLIPYDSNREANVIVRVETASRANTKVGRQSHRWRANLAVASLAGFRQRSSFESATNSLSDRETQIVAGRALVEVAVLIVIRASAHAELETRIREFRADARRLGVRIERGNARHALWWCAALAGSPGWRAL